MKRESMEFDVVIVGAGPAGLATAIKLAQLNQILQKNISICVLEKGANVGAHILSGAILEPTALNELIPDWQQQEAPVTTAVTTDRMYFLTAKTAWRLPLLPTMKNHGNYIISLGALCRWLATQAEALGVNIFSGFSASALLFDQDQVIGVQTSDCGLDANGKPTNRFQAGINLYAKQLVLAEGARGSLTEQIISKYDLRQHADPQTYGIGFKEIWRTDPKKHQAGLVMHTVGWPLDHHTYGGSFIYHASNTQLAIGFVAGLDYQNPYFDPFAEFQRFKLHPLIKPLLEQGECIQYGARALNEGGIQSLPKLTFPGGLLVGCAAGFLNVPKIKGTHTAMKSGMLAAETIMEHLEHSNELTSYSEKIQTSWIHQELQQARNVRPSFRAGLLAGLSYAAIDQLVLRGKAPWTLHHKPDHLALKVAQQCSPIAYPKPDGKITFDRLTQVYLSNTRHREDQPCHLKLRNSQVAIDINLARYDAPEQRYCPAGVYEIVKQNDKPKLQINYTNCIHCKTCDIKDPTQNIVWTTPEGGDGPNYTDM